MLTRAEQGMGRRAGQELRGSPRGRDLWPRQQRPHCMNVVDQSLFSAHSLQRPTGLVMHIADIYIRELVKRSDVPQGVVIALFRPFAQFIGHTNEFVDTCRIACGIPDAPHSDLLREHISQEIFAPLIENDPAEIAERFDVCLSY